MNYLSYLQLETLPTLWLYELYKYWSIKNIGYFQKDLTSNMFTRRLKPLLSDKGFELDTKSNRIKNIKGFPYRKLVDILSDDSNQFRNKYNKILTTKDLYDILIKIQNNHSAAFRLTKNRKE